MSDRVGFSQIYQTFRPGIGDGNDHLRGDGRQLYLHSTFSLSGFGKDAADGRADKFKEGARVVAEAIDHEFGPGVAARVLQKVSGDVGRNLGAEILRGDLPLIRAAIIEDLMPVGVLMPGLPHAQPWTPSMASIGPELATLAMNNPTARLQTQAAIQQKITDGALVANTLVNLNAPTPLTEKNITDLMWYLQARGETKTGTNNAPDITYTLPDPHGYILRSFDQATSATQGGLAYQRDSSHLTGFQLANAGNAPRGVNLIATGPADYDRKLPHGSQTVLYQKMSQGVNGYPADRIFLKPESDGMYYSTPKLSDPNGPSRGHLTGDRSGAIGHSLGFAGSLARKITGNNSPEGSFKERLPPTVTDDYKALVAKATPALKILLEQNSPNGDSSGLHVMLTNIAQAKASNTLQPMDFLLAAKTFTDKYAGGADPVYDNPTLRIGQEIIFNQNDL